MIWLSLQPNLWFIHPKFDKIHDRIMITQFIFMFFNVMVIRMTNKLFRWLVQPFPRMLLSHFLVSWVLSPDTSSLFGASYCHTGWWLKLHQALLHIMTDFLLLCHCDRLSVNCLFLLVSCLSVQCVGEWVWCQGGEIKANERERERESHVRRLNFSTATNNLHTFQL